MLTRKQRDLLIFINDYTQNTGISPSFEEMKDALQLKSKSGIHRLIKALVERGFLERLEHKARALQVKKMPENMTQSTNGNIEGKFDTNNDDFENTENLTQIPLHGKISAGTPIEAIRQEQDTIGIPSNMLGSKSCYALTVEGDSMIKAGIMDGDVVIIEECDRANNGDIVVALVDEEEVTLKRLRREIGSIVLMPENDAYEPIRLEPQRVRIQGKLKSLFRYY